MVCFVWQPYVCVEDQFGLAVKRKRDGRPTKGDIAMQVWNLGFESMLCFADLIDATNIGRQETKLAFGRNAGICYCFGGNRSLRPNNENAANENKQTDTQTVLCRRPAQDKLWTKDDIIMEV